MDSGAYMKSSDQELERLLAENVKGVAIDAQMVRSHIIRPPHRESAFSDHGSEGSTVLFVPQLPIVGLPYYLDGAAFGSALDDALQDSVAGYVAQLRQNGQVVYSSEWQDAKRPQDGTERWTPDVQQHVASVSKLVTAMAMTRLLSENNISPDAPIIDYLPDYWAKGPNIEYISFRHLWNHTSGLTAADVVDFDIMKSAIATGIGLGQNENGYLGHYCYQNLNYALSRILLAVITGNVSKSAVFPPLPFLPPSNLNDTIWDLVTIASYDFYMQGFVFHPAAVVGATLNHLPATGLAYRGPDDSGPGWNSGDLEENCGGDGWHLSVNQLLDVMGEFRRGGGILTPAAAQAMLENMFGVDPFVTYGCAPAGVTTAQVGLSTLAGVVHCKPGDWYDSLDGRHEQSLAYFLPQDMELAVLVNSQIVGLPDTFFRDVVTQAYVNNLREQVTVFP